MNGIILLSVYLIQNSIHNLNVSKCNSEIEVFIHNLHNVIKSRNNDWIL